MSVWQKWDLAQKKPIFKNFNIITSVVLYSTRRLRKMVHVAEPVYNVPDEHALVRLKSDPDKITSN